MSAYFITACGTGIGKTFTTCALIHAARAAGREVRAYKPVISGFDVADAESDTARIMGALEIPPPKRGRNYSASPHGDSPRRYRLTWPPHARGRRLISMRW